MTKKELEAENAALRELLAAARAYADMPHPASYDNRNYMYEYELERRVDTIAVWANGDQEDMDPGVYVPVIADRAKHLREEAAKPVRYEVKPAPADDEYRLTAKDEAALDAAPVITDSERTCQEANPASGAWCHKSGPHAEHRDTDGETWTTAGAVTA